MFTFYREMTSVAKNVFTFYSMVLPFLFYETDRRLRRYDRPASQGGGLEKGTRVSGTRRRNQEASNDVAKSNTLMYRYVSSVLLTSIVL